MVSDAIKLVCSCKGCQYYARQTHLSAHALQTIPITWPFAVWGLDLVVPLKRMTGGFTHLLIAIDKFFKWIEACHIIHRFRVPNCIITDNGTQFTGKRFLELCDDHHIRVLWSAIAHPKTNGQVERANGMFYKA
jgi:transposase InsO family protein